MPSPLRLWVNSPKDFRNASWYVEALQNEQLKDCTTFLLGVNNTTDKNLIYTSQDSFKKTILQNLTLLEYTDQKEYYLRAKYFVLPASLIYLNHSLLEAMSYGVVPIVTAAAGAEQIITNNQDGFITEYTKEAFAKKMTEVLSINDSEYNQLSVKAREKIISDFSIDYYKKRLWEMYKIINPVL